MNYESVALWSQVVSAALFVLAMVWIWLKFIQPAVLAAQSAHNARIAEAERHRDEAKAALGALQGEIEKAHRDARAIKERAAAQAQSEREAILQESHEAGERALRNAKGELERARAAARVQLREELLERALDSARERAAARIDERVNSRLVNSFLSSIEHGDPK